MYCAQSSDLKQLNKSFGQRLAIEARNSELIQTHLVSVADVDNNVENVSSTARLSRSETHHALNDIREKVDQLPGMSAEQFTVLKEMLRQLGAWAPALQKERARPDEADVNGPHDKMPNDCVEEHHDSNHGDETDPILLESVGRLCSLARQKERIAYSDEAQYFIDDLENLLNAILKQASKLSAKAGFLKRKRR